MNNSFIYLKHFTMNFELIYEDRLFFSKSLRFLALVISIVVFFYMTRKSSEKLNNISLYLIFMSLSFVASKLTSLLEKYLVDGFIVSNTFFQNSGDRVSGPAFICLILYLFYSKKRHLLIPLNYMLLSALPALALGKLSCFLLGDTCFGIPTNNFLGIFVQGLNPTMVKVHPVPIYDAIFYTSLFIIFLLTVKKNKMSTAKINILLFLTISIYGFLIEFIRVNPAILYSLTINQFFYLIIILITVMYMIKNIFIKTSSHK